MAIPDRTRIDADEFLAHTRGALVRFEDAGGEGRSVLTNHGQQAAIHVVEEVAEAAQAPLQRIEHELHTPVAFLVIPLFALANAGVALPADAGAALAHPVTLGIVVGLLLGKPVGITLFAWLAVRLRLAEMPAGASLGAAPRGELAGRDRHHHVALRRRARLRRCGHGGPCQDRHLRRLDRGRPDRVAPGPAEHGTRGGRAGD